VADDAAIAGITRAVTGEAVAIRPDHVAGAAVRGAAFPRGPLGWLLGGQLGPRLGEAFKVRQEPRDRVVVKQSCVVFDSADQSESKLG